VKKTAFSFLLIALFSSAIAQSLPADKNATPETQRLYANLQRVAQQGIMFGHQDALAYGVGWQYEPGRSDVRSVADDYPAVYGWDLGHLELGDTANLDAVPFSKMREFIQTTYARGGVNTISWHLNNPYNGKTAWDTTTTIRHILAGGKTKRTYKRWLNNVAGFMKSLKGPNGEAVPVIFRPFHELSGSWFWWGKKECTPEEYVQLWQYTVRHLQKKKVHNLLYAYSTDVFGTKENYLERYPGDAYVDIVGFDTYHRNSPASDSAFIQFTRQQISILQDVAREHKKVSALTETGLEQVTEANWWTDVLLKAVEGYDLSYVLLWRNGRPDHYYAPYPGQLSAENFKQFARHERVYLEKKVAAENLYK
jgi:mannan endo-1,4-beta-mannosidase